jgi:hypothetical protein
MTINKNQTIIFNLQSLHLHVEIAYLDYSNNYTN